MNLETKKTRTGVPALSYSHEEVSDVEAVCLLLNFHQSEAAVNDWQSLSSPVGAPQFAQTLSQPGPQPVMPVAALLMWRTLTEESTGTRAAEAAWTANEQSGSLHKL